MSSDLYNGDLYDAHSTAQIINYSFIYITFPLFKWPLSIFANSALYAVPQD